jgi:hypothetical protein
MWRFTNLVFQNKDNLLNKYLQKFTLAYELVEYARTHPFILNPLLDFEDTTDEPKDNDDIYYE